MSRRPGPWPSTVGDVMTHSLVAVREGTSCKEVVRILRSNHRDEVPVVDARRQVVGVVTATDVLLRHGARSAGELMSAPAVTARVDTSIADAVRLALQSGHGCLPVLDDVGVLVGVVTRTDLAAVLLRPDRELRDDVADALGSLGEGRAPVVRFDVAEGVVTLRSAGTSAVAASRLVERIGALPGVVAVVSQLAAEDGSPTAGS